MLVEHRTYTLHPGKVPVFLGLYEAEGIKIQTRILGRMIGYFTTEIGPLNQIIHMWGYEDLVDRAKRRAELMADPGFQAFGAKIQPLILTMENKILIPTAFSPIR
jgi:hypothetical protein